MATKILLADDHPEVRSALKLLLEQESAWQVVGEVEDADALLQILKEDCPDIVLLDWELPYLRPDPILKIMLGICSDLKVVALSSQLDARKGALSANVDAFVSKGDPPATVLETLYSLLGPPREGSTTGNPKGD